MSHEVVDIAYQAYLSLGGDPDPDAYAAYRQARQEAEAAARKEQETERDMWRQFQEERQRMLEQRSAAEVPGFHARTTIDDTIGKLYALRCQLRTPIPAELDGILDDIEALVERAVEMGFDPDADRISDDRIDDLLNTGSDLIGVCSCGAEYIGYGEPR